MTGPTAQPSPQRARPDKAIEARRLMVTAKVTAVEQAVKAILKAGAPVTKAGVAGLAGVSRSFVYENEQARLLIAAALARTNAREAGRSERMTAHEEASWRERALNAEEGVRELRRAIESERRLVGDLMGQLRQPDGTWIEEDRIRLRDENTRLLSDRQQLVRERNELQRKLDGARANLSRLNEQRVHELFPNGPSEPRGEMSGTGGSSSPPSLALLRREPP